MTVVLGAIERRKRMSWDGLVTFCVSLRERSQTTKVVMFNWSPEDVAIRQLFDRHQIENVNALTAMQHYGITDLGVAVGRFLLYRKWLQSHEAGQVFLVDTLDVLWQTDPEAFPKLPAMTVYQENQRIASCPYNAKWVTRYAPLEQDRQWMDRPVVCCGVIVGPTPEMQAYLAHYASQTARALETGWYFSRGWDTAVLADYAYGKLACQVMPYGHRDCVHLGYAVPETVAWKGTLVVSGISPRIVHQYRHHPEVARAVFLRFGGAA